MDRLACPFSGAVTTGAVTVMDGWADGSPVVATVGEVADAEDEDRDLFNRFGGGFWDSVVKLTVCETAELGSDSAFLFSDVWMAGLTGGLGGGDRGFCVLATDG